MNHLTPQINMLDEIIVDNFAGGGGASTGIELATGRPVHIAINHDPAAVLLHKTNHPYTEHYCESVWEVDPVKACAGRPVGLAWFSPDCKHFSKAKGAALVDRKIRGLAWIVLRWAGTVRPRVIILENVEEFVTWGPVRKGKPIKHKAGQTFQKWKAQLLDLGYQVEYRELVAADYGTPTIRKRFVLVARCDGKPIVWPERTHAPADHPEVQSGKYKPWVPAASIIDWTLPCPSIFATSTEIKEQYGIRSVRPLADNTQKRIARGLDKFFIHSQTPFIMCNNANNVGAGINSPVPTITCGNRNYLTTPVMTAIGQTGFSDDRSYSPDEPVRTVVTKSEQCIAEPVLSPFMATLNHSKAKGYDGRDLREPHSTMTAKNGCGVVVSSLIQYHSEQSDYTRGQNLESPICTVDGSNRYGLQTAALVKYYGNDQNGQEVAEPLHTVTAKDREGLITAHISKFYAGNYSGDGSALEKPLDTITTIDHNSLCAAHIAEFKGQDKGQSAFDPLRTITASAGEFGAVKTKIVRYTPGQELHYWPQIRSLLNTYCGYHLADNEILLFDIGGIMHFIADIGLRMLTPKELYAAQGFPDDYIIDHDYTGKEYPKTQQVARCGNAVCPPLAKAVVQANMTDWCVIGITTMQQLINTMAV